MQTAVEIISLRLEELRNRATSCERAILSTVLTYGRRELLPADWQPRCPVHRTILGAIRTLPEDVPPTIKTVHQALHGMRLSVPVWIVTSTEPLPPGPQVIESMAHECMSLWDCRDTVLEALQKAEVALLGVCHG